MRKIKIFYNHLISPFLNLKAKKLPLVLKTPLLYGKIRLLKRRCLKITQIPPKMVLNPLSGSGTCSTLAHNFLDTGTRALDKNS